MSDEQADSRKVSVTLALETIDTIKKIARANKTTRGTAITDSVKINEILTEAEKQHAKILLRYPDGRMEEIVRHRSQQ
jgi:hypothetical protein